MFDWPIYTLMEGWLIDDSGNVCPCQPMPLLSYTANEAEKWLAENDLRGTVRGSTWKLEQSRDYRATE